MDKLSKDMKACEKAGFGVHYGWWKASQAAKEEKPKTTAEKKLCKNCGKELVIKQKGKGKLFCDNICRDAYRARNKPPRPVVMKICEYCGKQFVDTRKNRRFCQPNCGRYYREKKNGE